MKYDITKDFETAKNDLRNFVLKDGDLEMALYALEDGELLMKFFEDEPLLEDDPSEEGDFEEKVVEAVYTEIEAAIEARKAK